MRGIAVSALTAIIRRSEANKGHGSGIVDRRGERRFGHVELLGLHGTRGQQSLTAAPAIVTLLAEKEKTGGISFFLTRARNWAGVIRFFKTARGWR